MRFVSFTLTAWPRLEITWTRLAKILSDRHPVICLKTWKSKHLKVYKILKGHTVINLDWIFCVFSWGVRCSFTYDTGSMGSCWFLVAYKGFVKNSSSIQTMKCSVFVKSDMVVNRLNKGTHDRDYVWRVNWKHQHINKYRQRKIV